MSYREHLPPSWGCLPAAAFGIVFAIPAVFLIILGECEDQQGHIGECTDDGLYIFIVALVTALAGWLIVWTTNRTIRALGDREIAPGWGVVCGFMYVAIILAALYFALPWTA
jgi:hypothetical protein